MRRTLWFSGLLMSLLMAVLPVTPASAATVRFGAKLTRHTQPTPAETCHDNAGGSSTSTCTWVAVVAFENMSTGNNQKAPKAGTIGKVRLISCVKGTFTVQVARKQSGSQRYKVVKNGPVIDYKKDTQSGGCGGPDEDNYKIQTFNVSFTVNKGDYIAVKASKVGFIHNSSSGDSYLFRPPLSAGGGFQSRDGSSGGLLIQFQYK
ncbi:MAG: hypothetical protein U0667_16740 [Chloroflexota bacterium]